MTADPPTPPLPPAAAARARLRAWRADPALFVTQALGTPPLPWQAAALADIAAQPHTAIRSGHGVGKSALLAWVLLWWLLTRHPAKIAATAPTAHQLADVLWGEVRAWHRRLPPALAAQLVVRADRVDLAGAAGESFAVARTARRDQPEAFQGFHSPHMLFLVDEASGVDDAVFAAGAGAMSSAGARTVLAGNPTRASGAFFDAFHKDGPRWARHHVPASASPLVAPEFVEDMAARYGRDSNTFRVRVAGEFPAAEADGTLPLDLIEAARARTDIPPAGRRVWGLDLARFGSDASALVERAGPVVPRPPLVWHGADLMASVGRVVSLWEDCPRLLRPAAICVDVVGMGAGAHDRLRELGLPSVPVNVAECPDERGRFRRRRDELWWRCRAWLATRAVALPDCPDLAAELAAPRYAFASDGRIEVERKDSLRARGRASPDRADALCLTFATAEPLLGTLPHRPAPGARASLKGFV